MPTAGNHDDDNPVLECWNCTSIERYCRTDQCQDGREGEQDADCRKFGIEVSAEPKAGEQHTTMGTAPRLSDRLGPAPQAGYATDIQRSAPIAPAACCRRPSTQRWFLPR